MPVSQLGSRRSPNVDKGSLGTSARCKHRPALIQIVEQSLGRVPGTLTEIAKRDWRESRKMGR